MDLNIMYDDCKEYQDNILTYQVPPKVEKVTYLLFCMQNELQEIANCIQWKNWKAPKDVSTKQFNEIINEMVDVLFFYFELCTAFSIPIDVLETRFYKKMKINYKRIEEEELKHRMGDYTDVKT